MRRFLFFLLAIFISLLFFASSANADELEDIQKQINDLQKALDDSKKAVTPLEGQVKSLEEQLASINARLFAVQKDLKKSEEDLAYQKETLAQTVRSFYIGSFVDIPFLTLFASGDATHTLRLLTLQAETSRQDRQIISNISEKIAKLADDKKRLASAQAQTSKQSQFLKGEIASAKAFQSELEGKISTLTARQEEILAAKNQTFTTSVGDVPLADDPNASPSFNPGFSPAFSGFSFGAYTHRNGMSQYGAKGRADGGQKAEEILSHYYSGSTLNKNFSVPSNITVEGYGSMSFEDTYMKRIYEMPNSFPKEALKAQAVAARTYAIRYTEGGAKPICTSQSCQVYQNSDKGGAWEEAVAETRGWVLEGGSNAQYSSTTGGYLNNSGWDTKCGSKDCWTPEAYEKLASSPWFYKGWYTQSYSNGSAKCGRNSPWLNQEEMADILNAWLVQGKDGVEGGRITPVTTSCWGGSPYSISELADLANSKAGGAVTSVSSVSVSYNNDGKTANVSFSTNRGSVSVSGSDFKTIFNLRAPGYISIRSPLFNIEQK
ncbi:hypothetical protein A2870_01915 [Candidatus Curtissbacteria bacterium RIFCSPHIGHO2_01_FULL_41_11]|uniref:Sporulation stage II protein D amidase enhancer LytB N-terminal domain-containing protein n=1 Tax=Candidatus Curtissbacteria bacterium RIFCSPHIGHO2_01_FULL_41_11 TaxID=1797711 RepID=A0A1F5G3W0_9BACT|nr:MAG: hypothetical protein A2870_01915 [Candidatus Curtissbacteria bacterium RIFCSPHIGHO2_01_FULL_41_11]